MRNRHFPRLCGTCHAPLARQEDTCWRCGAQWRSDEAPAAPTLRVISGDAPAAVAAAIGHRPAAGVRTHPRAATEAGVELDRWTDEGGSLDPEPDALVAADSTRT
jgi:hypothetical protein